MDLSNIGRNDPCPCGSGKKFKRCHLGREQELYGNMLEPDPGTLGRAIVGLPACTHQRATEMAAGLKLRSAAGREMAIKLVDLAAFRALNPQSQGSGPAGPGGVLISPQKTRPFDPGHVYIALSPDAGDSTVIHQLAHAADLLEGSGLPPGWGQDLAAKTGLPVELLEHPQEFGDRLLKLADEFTVELDAEDEIIAILARRQLLLPGKLIAAAKREELVAAAEKTLRYMQENQAEIDARIRERTGYAGSRPARA